MSLMKMLLAGFLAAVAVSSRGADSFDVRANYNKFEYRIPMRDGVRLFTAVYAPKDTSQKWPILLTRTPYSVGPYGVDKYRTHVGPSDKFAEDKFIFVYQDARGRFQSEGEFVDVRPIRSDAVGSTSTDESTDAYDTIDWLVKNVPNNNGKVGMVGISYDGFYTDAALVHAHPALVAASPQAPMADLYMGDDAYHSGAFMLVANFSFYTGFMKQSNPVFPEKQEKEFAYGTKDGYKFYLNMGPLANAEQSYFHRQNSYWTDLIEHTTYDRYWQERNILPHLKTATPAVLVVGGWFDAEDLSGTLKTFRAIEAQSAQTENKLVMGPWAHGAWQRSKGDKLGDISFGSDTGPFFENEILLPFFRHYLKGAPDPGLPAAYVFETGKNVWRKEQHWPPAKAQPEELYLRAGGKLSFDPAVETSGFDEYVSDPNKPVPFLNKPALYMEPEYMDGDQRFVKSRPDVLSYETEPLAADVTIAGPISPTLVVSSSGTDSDFDVKLVDVYPDDALGGVGGYEQLVRGEPFRGKFRNSFEQPQPFTPGEVQQIHFTMPDAYHCFLKGHKILVQVQSSWFPLTDRNPQTFSDIPHARPDQFVRATERIYRSPGAASFVEINIVRERAR
ncbi:MAG: CocE/NonD family hydrolase [Acidobacteriaceae bacterium]|nr:CocE/NonD family hydrolase [Acidobacteriaceae bacterium]